jgi:hypothetical protein
MFVFNNAVDVVDVLTYFSGAAVITSGSINGATIGNSSASTGAFTTLAASGNTTLSGNLTVNGDTTLGNASGDIITANASSISVPNNLAFVGTGTITLPNGTTGERPTPADGMIRYNTTTAGFEGYTTTGWGNIGGGASAGGAIYENKNTISASYTLTTNYNGMSVGPLTIDTGVVVTVPSGQRWVIL